MRRRGEWITEYVVSWRYIGRGSQGVKVVVYGVRRTDSVVQTSVSISIFGAATIIDLSLSLDSLPKSPSSTDHLSSYQPTTVERDPEEGSRVVAPILGMMPGCQSPVPTCWLRHGEAVGGIPGISSPTGRETGDT